MFEFVALRDIQEGEEILINYGQEWQDAWDAHVAKWTPPKYSESYDTCVRAQQ
jgi:SET domain-containing protein